VIQAELFLATSTSYIQCRASVFLQEVQANKANLSEFQQRLVSYYLHEARINGIEKFGEDRKIFMQTLHQLAEDKKMFQ